MTHYIVIQLDYRRDLITQLLNLSHRLYQGSRIPLGWNFAGFIPPSFPFPSVPPFSLSLFLLLPLSFFYSNVKYRGNTRGTPDFGSFFKMILILIMICGHCSLEYLYHQLVLKAQLHGCCFVPTGFSATDAGPWNVDSHEIQHQQPM